MADARRGSVVTLEIKRMTSEGRKDRTARLQAMAGGAWGSYSQDFMYLCNLLYEQSAAYARRFDGNVSPYALAGIPLLFSALRALLIECNSGMYGKPLGDDTEALSRLSKEPNELQLLKEKYALSDELIKHLGLLYEVRNEIAHPSHRPSGTPDNTPEYLRVLKTKGLFQSTGDSQGDYAWLAQLQSHKLLSWAFAQIEQVASELLQRHHASPANAREHAATYSRFRHLDL